MGTIRTIVQSVLVIIMTAAFLEIVLPRSDIKRYINLIIGLFVVIAVLNPFLEAVHKELSFDVFDRVAVSQEETKAIISRGKELAANQKSQAAGQFKEKMARQVASLAALFPDAGVQRVEIDVVEDTADPRFGQVKRITLYRSGNPGKQSPEGTTGIPAVEDVNVGDISPGTGRPGSQAETPDRAGGEKGLREMIANFYGLTPDQVAVQN